MNNSQNGLLSVIIPCFNEEENIESLMLRLAPVLSALHYQYEIIFVDDGSQDNTVLLIKKYIKENKRIRLISFSRNFGNQIGVSVGFEYAKGDAVITMDADLQHPPELLPELIKCWEEGYEKVHTCRQYSRDESFFKRLTSSWFYRFFSKISEMPFDENIVDYCLLDRKVVAYYKLFREKNRFVRGLIHWLGFTYKVIPFSAEVRRAGHSKFSIKKLIFLSIDAITSFSAVPLRMVSFLGISISLLSFVYLVYIVVKKIFLGAVSGWASTVGMITFLGGIQLIAIGIVGEYLTKVYDEVKGRPLYIIKEKMNI